MAQGLIEATSPRHHLLGVLVLVASCAGGSAGPGQVVTTAAAAPAASSSSSSYELDDVHVHLTNYIQEGTPIEAFVGIMGQRVGRAAVFGIPFQQTWSYRISGDRAPTYYLDTDAPLYYYSFTDAYIATAYRSLPPDRRARLDPMITGFNPADMYAADHVRRVLLTFPGVFSGIGEFTIHKEFVSSKVAGEIASLNDPALDRLLDFAGEVGLVALMHNDIDIPFPKPGAVPVYLDGMKAVLKRHPKTTIIWAHIGLGRVVRPVKSQVSVVSDILDDPELQHVYFDISWSEVAKYLVATPETTAVTAEVMRKHPNRFLFGTDEVAPPDPQTYVRVYRQYDPLWNALDPQTRDKIRKGNYERLFDEARRRVRAWEKTQQK